MSTEGRSLRDVVDNPTMAILCVFLECCFAIAYCVSGKVPLVFLVFIMFCLTILFLWYDIWPHKRAGF